MGCFRVWIGSESGSQRILDAMERGVTVDEVQTAVGLCRSNGIQTGMFLMWGYEGEELDDVEATIQHVKKTDPDIFFTTVAYPIEGTDYSSQVADAGGAFESRGASARTGMCASGAAIRATFTGSPISYFEARLNWSVRGESLASKPT